jgi:hypothetical protein
MHFWGDTEQRDDYEIYYIPLDSQIDTDELFNLLLCSCTVLPPENYFRCVYFMILLTLHRCLFVAGKCACVGVTFRHHEGTVELKEHKQRFLVSACFINQRTSWCMVFLEIYSLWSAFSETQMFTRVSTKVRRWALFGVRWIFLTFWHYLCRICLRVILPSVPEIPKWSLTFRFSNQIPVSPILS